MQISLSDPAPVLDSASPSVAPPARTARVATGSDGSFAQLLQGIGRELGRGEATTRAAIASISTGTDVTPARLIALQTGVYRYSEAVDLASRLVDRVTGGVKTVLQGNGQ